MLSVCIRIKHMVRQHIRCWWTGTNWQSSTSITLNISFQGSFFCNQQCFKANWDLHKVGRIYLPPKRQLTLPLVRLFTSWQRLTVPLSLQRRGVACWILGRDTILPEDFGLLPRLVLPCQCHWMDHGFCFYRAQRELFLTTYLDRTMPTTQRAIPCQRWSWKGTLISGPVINDD